MAESVFSLFLYTVREIFTDSLIERIHSRVHANILWAEGDLAKLRYVIEHIEAQPDNGLADKIKQWKSRAKKLESEATSLTETCMKELEQWQGIPGHAYVKLFDYNIMSNNLRKILEEMCRIRISGEKMGVTFRQQKADTLNLQGTTSKNSIYAYANSAITNLEVASGKLLYFNIEYKDIKSTRSELLPLFEILKQVENLNVYRDVEMYKVWTLMVEDIFKSIDKKSLSFQELPPGERGLERHNVLDFFIFIRQKKEEVLMLWRRCQTYGVGLVISQMKPATLFQSFFPTVAEWVLIEQVEAYKKLLDPIIEVFKKDQMLMNALWKDANGMEELDERGKIWVKNMKELHRELDVVCEKYLLLEYKEPSLALGIDNMQIGEEYGVLLQSAQLLEEFFYFLTMRKTYYCIDSFVQRDGSSSRDTEAVPLPSNLFTKDPVELVQIELQLMDALFQDVKTIRNPDDRLTVWIQEMRSVANHSKPIIQRILNGSFMSKLTAHDKIGSIGERIRYISEWSLTYGIGSIISENGSPSHSQESEEVSSYHKNHVANEVDLIRREVRMMHALERDIRKMHEINSGTLEAWLEEMSEVAGEAQILISSYSNEGNNAQSGREVLQNVSLIKSKIKGLHQRRREYGIEHFDRKLSYKAEELRAILLADDESESFRIIQVLGAWDNDKEFVKKFIEEDYRIVSRYALLAWLSGGEANEANITRVIEQKNSNDSLMVLQAEDNIVEDECTQKRSLIVLDELRSSFNWNSVRDLLGTLKGSRVILITSQRNVDLYGLNPSEMFSITMRELLPDRKISMSQMAPERSDSNPSLTTPNSSIETIPSYLMTCLYYFLLFSPTNSDNYIPVRRLISLWVAEGFVRSEDDVPLERIAMIYLSELMRLGVVEAKENRGKLKRCRLKDDKRDACLTKAKEEHFLQERRENPGQGNYFGVEIGNILRLADHHQPGDVNNNSCHYHIHDPANHPTQLTSHYKGVISFLSFDTQEGTKPGEDIGIFLDKGISKKCFLSLRILDLEHIFRPVLPKELSKLIRLRYLGLRWTYLEALPQSVSGLLLLQVLDVKHTYISKLPKSIWRMQYLRHLYLSETYRTRFEKNPYRRFRPTTLTNLQTLWGAFVDEDSPVEGGLDTLLNVRKLGLLCRSMDDPEKMVRQLEAVANWVVRLKDLESLRLRSQDQKGMPSDLYLRPLSTQGNLSVLHISGILKYPSVISDLPLNLTEVTLSGCKLEIDPLHSMEFLPRLIILRLLGDSSMCQKMRCSSRGFPKLEVLRLWNLEMLKELEVEERGMPHLQEFEIRYCLKLEKLPDRLG